MESHETVRGTAQGIHPSTPQNTISHPNPHNTPNRRVSTPQTSSNSTTTAVPLPPFHSTWPFQPAFLLVHCPCRTPAQPFPASPFSRLATLTLSNLRLNNQGKEARTTLPSSSPVYTLCGMGAMHVTGAPTFFPSSRDESVWLSSLSSVMFHAPVRSGASWKICGCVS